MKLLIITRKVDVNDERMGFFVDWINEFAKNCEKLFVISMQGGSREGLEKNVEVYFASESINQVIKRFRILRKLILFIAYRRLLKQLVPKIDGIFVHMIPLYVNIAGPYVKKHNKKLMFWYAHGSVNRQLKKTEKWTDVYITSSKKSFRMQTKKPVVVTGQGILVDKFKNQKSKLEIQKNHLRILTVGRISPSKNLEILIDALRILRVKYQASSIKCNIIGAPALIEDQKYLENLKKLTKKHNLENSIYFLDAKAHSEVIHYYAKSDLFINLSSTGSLDKVVLEAMAASVIPITSNEAFEHMLKSIHVNLVFQSGNSQELAKNIQTISQLGDEEKKKIQETLRTIVEKEHNLENTVKKIIKLLASF